MTIKRDSSSGGFCIDFPLTSIVRDCLHLCPVRPLQLSADQDCALKINEHVPTSSFCLFLERKSQVEYLVSISCGMKGVLSQSVKAMIMQSHQVAGLGDTRAAGSSSS